MPKYSQWKRMIWVVAMVISAAGCQSGYSSVGPSDAYAATPAEFAKGEASYNKYCAMCHGLQGAGAKLGPPLVHKIYEPGHHGDASFHVAARKGVKAHHWPFGDMPPIAGASEGEVKEIIDYVRWLQRQAGIF